MKEFEKRPSFQIICLRPATAAIPSSQSAAHIRKLVSEERLSVLVIHKLQINYAVLNRKQHLTSTTGTKINIVISTKI
jgi:hypothetical protein